MQQSNANNFNINNLGGAAELQAVIRSMLASINTGELVEVIGVSATGVAPVGFVSVRPLVYKVDGDNNNIERGVIHNVPYFRLQGGTNAVIIDPAIGDIGFCGVCSRDISLVKRVRSYAAPNMRRVSDISDAVFFGGWSAKAPTQYVHFSGGNIIIKAANQVVIDAPNLQVNGTINASGVITGAGISLSTHTHGGVQSGSSSTGVAQ